MTNAFPTLPPIQVPEAIPPGFSSPLERRTFEAFRTLVYDTCGIVLRDGKEAMVRARIGKRMRALGIEHAETYLALVTGDRGGDEIVHLLDAISTNVTHFYREPEHFTFLTECMAKWLKAGQKRFRIWSAAASSGEEPYTMAITLLEACAGIDADLRILATDISTKVLDKCHLGEYAADKMEGVPAGMLERYFERKISGDKVLWRAKAALRKPLLFRRLNLVETPYPMQGPMDVIFCRNVMIYFDNELRRRLLGEAYRLLKKGGYLFVGHAESLTGMMSDLKCVKPSIYIKP